MKEINVTIGQWYVVEGAAGDTVTNPSTGRPIATVEDGKQTSFYATTAVVVASSDSVQVYRANFKSAPAKLMALGLFGGGSTNALPSGYIKVKGIKFTNSIELSVNVTDSRKPTEMVSEFCVITQPTNWLTQLGYYDDNHHYYNRLGVTHASYVPEEYSNIIYYRKQSGGISLNYMQELILHKWYDFHAFADGKIMLNKELYHYEDVGNNLFQYTYLLFNYRPYIERINGHQSFSYDGNMQFDLYPCITPTGIAAFYDKVKNEVLFVSSPIAYLTSPQARNLRKLPAGGGTLTISLPEGYESDSGVAAALETARSNGWTLTIQTYTPENATAGASTFALRRIWVRKTQAEQGTYVDADGTRWQVDWCVDMLTPDGSTPDSHGYELFRSMDAAVAYWELSPWVDPNADELLTNSTTNEHE